MDRPSPEPVRPLDEDVGDHDQHGGDGQPGHEELPAAHVQLLRPEEREHGPVPQVDAVADLADEHQRRPAERTVEPAGRRRGAAGQDQRGADGEEREAAVVEPLAGPADEPHDDDADEGDRRQQVEPVPDRGFDAVAAGPEGDGGRAADEDRGRPGVGAEVGACPVGPGLEEQPLRDDGRGDGDHREGEERPGRSLGDLPHDQGDDRPDHVELLLDGQAPRVVERRRRPEGLPVGARAGELPPVGDVDGRGHHGPAQAHPGAALDQPWRAEDQDGQEQPQRGQQPPRPAGPERAEAEPAAAEVVEDEPGDEEARDREEQVDAEVAALQVAGVERHDGEHREAAQTVEGGHPRQARGNGRRRRKRSRHQRWCAVVRSPAETPVPWKAAH